MHTVHGSRTMIRCANHDHKKCESITVFPDGLLKSTYGLPNFLLVLPISHISWACLLYEPCASLVFLHVEQILTLNEKNISIC